MRLAHSLPCLMTLVVALATASAQEPSVVVEATLLAKSSIPKAETMWIYKEGLVTYEYQVDKVVSGTVKDKKILVAHYAVFRDMAQPVTKLEKGAKATLKLKPFDEVKFSSDNLPRTTDIDNVLSPLFFDVGQQLTYPQEGRWNYKTDVSRNMRSFHMLKNQLKLVVIGDCQSWFSNYTELHYKDENKETPVAMNLCQERSSLSFYKMMVDDYLVKLPKLEWVIIPYQMRWVTDAKWRAMNDKTSQFKGSPGYKHDQQHADQVFAKVDMKPITTAQMKSIPELSAAWNKHPWGQLMGIKPGAKARQEASKTKSKYKKVNDSRWKQWEAIVKTLTDKNIKVLAYTLPVHGASAKRDGKDKSGTTKACYDDILNRMKTMEGSHKGFYYYDINNYGDHGMPDSCFGNIDHLSTEGAKYCTEKVEAYRLQKAGN